ncbi:MAG TPA: molybdenum ABC transporter ATP-binding protein [Burkholderiales bacterium]|nr:molybdenum ABC transporter ATP-binding protein [Burkholderiales bacterium]
MLHVDVERRVGAFSMKMAFESDARVTALFGRSGAGKTSLVNLIAGLAKPDRGRIEISGQVLFDSATGVNVPAEARRVGYVFQEGRLFPHLTVRRNLLYGHDLVPAPERYMQFELIVKLLGLDDLLERRPGRLSGGEKQRVAIGRALLASPRVLLLDEPLASLDALRKAEILRYIELLHEELNIPMVYVSHAVEEVVRLADTVVVLAAGQVAAVGGVEEVMGRPELGGGAGLFEGGTVIDAKVTGHDMRYELATLAFDGGTLTVTNLDALIGEPVRVRIRARDVSIALDAPQRISIQNVLRGRIAAISQPRNGVVDLSIAVGAVMLRSRVTQRAADQLGLAAGLDVYAMIKAVSLDRLGASAR